MLCPWGFRFCVGLEDLNEMYYYVISVISFTVHVYICQASLIHKETEITLYSYVYVDRLFYMIHIEQFPDVMVGFFQVNYD